MRELIVAALGVALLAGYVIQSDYRRNMEDRQTVANAPVIKSVLPQNARTIWEVCSDETDTHNLRELCINRFKELNPDVSLGRIRNNVPYLFPDINNDGYIGAKEKINKR